MQHVNVVISIFPGSFVTSDYWEAEER